MKAGLAALLVTMAVVQALPATAREAVPAPQTPAPQTIAASSVAELPLTQRFASLLTSYRNCVLRQVDRTTQLGDQQEMAQNAMSACALSRGELRSQLIADIRNEQPHLSSALVLSHADTGLEQVDPMIEAAAIDWAHMRYARDMH